MRVTAGSPPPRVGAKAPVVDAPESGGSLLWYGIAGMGLLLGAAVVVVRTLRR